MGLVDGARELAEHDRGRDESRQDGAGMDDHLSAPGQRQGRVDQHLVGDGAEVRPLVGELVGRVDHDDLAVDAGDVHEDLAARLLDEHRPGLTLVGQARLEIDAQAGLGEGVPHAVQLGELLGLPVARRLRPSVVPTRPERSERE